MEDEKVVLAGGEEGEGALSVAGIFFFFSPFLSFSPRPRSCQKICQRFAQLKSPGARTASCSLPVFHSGSAQGCNIAPLLFQWDSATEEIGPGIFLHWVFFFFM